MVNTPQDIEKQYFRIVTETLKKNGISYEEQIGLLKVKRHTFNNMRGKGNKKDCKPSRLKLMKAYPVLNKMFDKKGVIIESEVDSYLVKKYLRESIFDKNDPILVIKDELNEKLEEQIADKKKILESLVNQIAGLREVCEQWKYIREQQKLIDEEE